MKKGTYLFISIYIIILLYKCCINYENWNSPHNLSFTYTLYKGRKIAEDEPLIIAYDKIFFLDNDLTKILYYKTGNIYTLYPGLYRMPLLYTNTIFSFYSLFVTKDYNIYLYQERGENTFDYKYLWYKEIKSLGNCYDTLRIYYEYITKYAAIYNYRNSEKIIVIDLFENGKNIVEINNKQYVKQSLIYSTYKKDKILLIIVDTQGIRFYNIQGYKSIWGSNDKGALIKYKDDGPFGMADFIDGNKILFAYYFYLVVYELDDVKIPSQLFSYYEFLDGDKFICVLGLKNGNALVGTNYGYIYLIEYVNRGIIILDNKKICDRAVSSLSYTNNCAEDSKNCYIFAANCGYIYVFEIANEKKEDLNNNDEGIAIGIVMICVIIIIAFLYENSKKKNS